MRVDKIAQEGKISCKEIEKALENRVPCWRVDKTGKKSGFT
jgi:hypothetical protein